MKKKKTWAKAIVIVATVFILAFALYFALGGRLGPPELKSDRLEWTMTPSSKYYLVNDGYEPADAYNSLEYDQLSKLYYIAYPGKADRYITNSGEAFKKTEKYKYLENINYAVSEEETFTYRFEHFDGTPAFDGEYGFAYDFAGGYGFVMDKKDVQIVINNKGEQLYKAESKHSDLYRLEDDLFVEIYNHSATLFNIKTKETLKKLDNCDWLEKCSIGYIIRSRSDQKAYALDENFNKIWNGRGFDRIDDMSSSKKMVFYTEDNEIGAYRDKDGNAFLQLKKGQCGGAYSEGKILVYSKDKVKCFDGQGKVLFAKKMTKSIDPTDISCGLGVGHFHYGLVPITLDAENYGIMDEKGNLLTNLEFRQVTINDNKTIMVSYEQKAGIIKIIL